MSDSTPSCHLGDPRLPARIWDKIEVSPESGCWLWTAYRTTRGYGRAYFERGYYSAHRLVYQQLVGPVPSGLDLDHLCRVRHCVNPAHLEPVSRQENLARGVGLVWMERAVQTRCKQGHPLEGDNLTHDKTGRRCRTCDRRRKREYKQRKKAA